MFSDYRARQNSAQTITESHDVKLVRIKHYLVIRKGQIGVMRFCRLWEGEAKSNKMRIGQPNSPGAVEESSLTK